MKELRKKRGSISLSEVGGELKRRNQMVNWAMRELRGKGDNQVKQLHHKASLRCPLGPFSHLSLITGLIKALGVMKGLEMIEVRDIREVLACLKIERCLRDHCATWCKSVRNY